MGNKVIEVKPIETKAVEVETVKSQELLVTAKQAIIENQVTYEAAGDVSKLIKTKQKELESMRRNITKPLDQAKKAVMDLFRKPLIMLAEAEGFVKKSMLDYTTKQERIRKEQEEKLARQAKAEEDRKKKALEEQARKKDEEARILREKAEKANAEEKARLEAEAKKKDEEAEAKREKKEEVHVEAPVLAPRTETPKGISYKTVWSAEVVDFSKLPDEYKLPNMPMLNKMAQATKGKVPILGVKFKSDKVVSSRSL